MSLSWSLWKQGTVLSGSNRMAFDTETVAVNLNKEIPPGVLLTAWAGEGDVVVVPVELWAPFIQLHLDRHWVGHNAAFDFHVILKHLRDSNASPELIASWIGLVDSNRMGCTQLLDGLVRIASGESDLGKEKDSKKPMRNLENLSIAYQIDCAPPDKASPYRKRFAELLEEPDWNALHVDQGFFHYACVDTKATYLIAEKLYDRAWQLHQGIEQELLHPQATEWGPLTLAIQMQGSVALAEIGRRGFHIDVDAAWRLEASLRSEYQENVTWLDMNYPGLVQKVSLKSRTKRKGSRRLSSKTGCVSFAYKRLRLILSEIAEDLGVVAPISDGKQGWISLKADDWLHLAEKNEFIRRWTRAVELTKQFSFLSLFRSQDPDDPTIRSRYITIVRTGRTSCQAPNVQQIPRLKEFRSLFTARPGKKLCVTDYSFIELRTLSYLTEKWQGKSKMADAIRAGKDPHTHTASLILEKEYEEVKAQLKLEKVEGYQGEKWAASARQASKACFHKDVEALTAAGWKKISELTLDDKICQLWPSRDYPNAPTGEFVKPLALTTREGKKLLRVHNESIDIRVTADHRMLGYLASNKPCVIFPEDMNNLLRGIYSAMKVESGLTLGALTPLLLRQAVCVQADGSYIPGGARFGFKKQRKVDRFLQLFPEARRTSSPGSAVHVFTVPWNSSWGVVLDPKTKSFKVESLLKLTLYFREVFLEEIQYWDGSASESSGRISFYSTDKVSIDAVQAVASITGKKSSYKGTPPRKAHHKECYSLSIKDRAYSRAGTFSIEYLEGDHDVYCLSVPSSFLLVRDGGKPVCIGNCNFGIPGGLGPDRLSAYAYANYGVDMSKDQAAEFRKKITTEIYPELNNENGWLASRPVEDLSRNLGIPYDTVFDHCCRFDAVFSRLGICMDRVLRGCAIKADGTPYNPKYVERLWSFAGYLLSHSPDHRHLCSLFTSYQPSDDLADLFFQQAAVTSTGRIRRGIGYTDSRNCPFQSLAADGAKKALWKLWKQGIQVVAFIHDEIVAEVEEGCEQEQKEAIEKAMIEGMEEVLEGFPVAVEGTLSTVWTK